MPVFKEPVHVDAKFSCKTLEVPTDYWLPASNARHRFKPPYHQANGSSVAADERVIHTVNGTTGIINSVKAGCITANVGDSTITVDIHKNGSTVLSSPISLSSSQSAYEEVTGAFANSTASNLVQGDSIEVVVAVTAGTGTLGQGLFVNIEIDEDPS